MVVEELNYRELRNLKNNINRRYDFIISDHKEREEYAFNIINEYGQCNSYEEMWKYLKEKMNDLVIEDIFMNHSTKMLDAYIEKYYNMARYQYTYNYNQAFTRINYYLLGLGCKIPYEIIEQLVENNETLQFLIQNYLRKEDGYVLNSTINKHYNFYIRNMLYIYCTLKDMPILFLDEESGFDVGPDYYDDFKDNNKRLTKEETKELVSKARDNDIDARNKIIVSYIPLLKKTAEFYASGTVNYMDLIQEGAFGVIRAINYYDEEKGSFTKYLKFWLCSYMNKYALQEKKHTSSTLSFTRDELVSNDEKICTIDQSKKDLNNIVENNDLKDKIKQLVNSDILTSREKQIIIERYGLIDGEYKPLEEVGNKLGVSRERIRQLEVIALNKIRSSQEAFDLADYGNNCDEVRKVLQKVRTSSPDKKQKYTINDWKNT